MLSTTYRASATLGAGGRLPVGGSGGGVRAPVLLQEEGGQLTREGAGALLRLAEGHQGLGRFGIDVAVDDGRGLLTPWRAEAFTSSRGATGSRVHGVRRGLESGRKRRPDHRTPRAQLQLRGCTRP